MVTGWLLVLGWYGASLLVWIAQYGDWLVIGAQLVRCLSTGLDSSVW